ncbi:tyrosine-type recombinase/integrase [Cellvibrio sp. ARAG 10.3]|uniref:tyrosine-type recombinase/integrase n=1 Tax=Cellvibrio sp. ARAG 10.3 TaxID=3451358 RepID=UPI003F48227F
MLLQKRSNGVYYFRWVFPLLLRSVLGKRELYTSLRTNSKKHALAKAGIYYMVVDQFQVIQDRYERGELSYDEYSNQAYEHFMRLNAQVLAKGLRGYSPSDYQELQRQKTNLDKSLDMIIQSRLNKKAEIAGGVTIYQRIWEHISSTPQLKLFKVMGDHLSVDPVMFERYLNDIVSLFHWVMEETKKKLHGTNIVPELPSYLLDGIAGSVDGLVSEDASTACILFSSLFDEFMTAKISLSPRDQSELRANFPIFLHFIGDLPLNLITSRSIKICLQKCQLLPRRNLGMYKDKSIAELAAMDIPEEHRVAARTVANFKKQLQRIFVFAKEMEYVTESPASNVKLDLNLKRARGNFSVNQMVVLLHGAQGDKHEWRKWIVLIGAYTGARLGEIVDLVKQNVRRDDDSQVLYFHIPDGKTANAIRNIPVHSKLVELGLLQYLESLTSQRLFPDKVKSRTITGWFPSFRDKLGVPSTNDFGESLTFHSIRHSFITSMRATGATTIQVQQLVGHESTEGGVTEVYTGRFTPGQLKPVVEMVKYLD